MTDAEVLRGCKESLKRQRRELVVFLRYLLRVDKRQLYLSEGYSSLRRFCIEELHLSKNCTAKRIVAVRVLDRFPLLAKYIESGDIHLSNIVLLSTHLTEKNHESLFEMASKKTEERLERELASLFPKSAMKKRFKLKWLNGEEAQIAATVPATFVEKLERIKDLRKRARPEGDEAAFLEEAMDSYLDRIDPLRKKTSKVSKKKARPEVHPRRVPQGIQDTVWKRDEGRCAYVASNGKRCGEMAYIELDHGIAWAHGGSSRDPDNIRLLCSGHNRYLARQTFGAKVPVNPLRAPRKKHDGQEIRPG
jgi:5-methylcytosine-specific restriction endonuclease McrA